MFLWTVLFLLGPCSKPALGSAPAESNTSAFVYISSLDGSNHATLHAFRMDEAGEPVSISGSPYDVRDVTNLAVNGRFLVGRSQSTGDLLMYSIANDGALTYHATIPAAPNSHPCPGSAPIFFDHSGSYLYVVSPQGDSCADSSIATYTLDRATGLLSLTGSSSQTVPFAPSFSVTGNNLFSVGGSCIPINHEFTSYVSVLHQDTDMLLQPLSSLPLPSQAADRHFCPAAIAADRTDHIAVAYQDKGLNHVANQERYRIASYTIDSQGALTQSGSPDNNPAVQLSSVSDIKMDPSGTMLAVGGYGGLQLFHFNGGDPPTAATSLPSTDELKQFFWDNEHHLYAIASNPSNNTALLAIYTASASSVQRRDFSLDFVNPSFIIVQPTTSRLPF